MDNEEVRGRCVGKCLFCRVGFLEGSKRGVYEVTKRIKEEGMIVEVNTYKCGLGEKGKDCIIPQIYTSSVSTSQIARMATGRTRRYN